MQVANRKAVIRLTSLVCMLALMLSGIAFPACAAGGFLPTREVNGSVYTVRPPSDLTTVLFIGYDHQDEGMPVEQKTYAQGGQSDFMLLVVLDHENRQIRQLQLDRDTMTAVKVYGFLGGYIGLSRTHLCLSHAYGDTQEMNNANTLWAVENLLGIGEDAEGVGIDWYMAMDISGIEKLNDALGGVTVPIEDDFSAYDPTMVQGTTMRLTGRQVEYYCRMRYGIGSSTNAERMVRQRRYMDAAADVFKAEVRKDVNFARRVLNEMGVIYDTGKKLDDGFGFSTSDRTGTPITETPAHYLMTSETLDDIVGLIAKVIDYETLPIETLPGEHIQGADGFIQYHLEEGAAETWAMNVFYDPLP